VCARHGVELPAAALQYSLRDPAVVTVTVGSRSRAQLRENSERMRVVIPEKLWTDLVIQGLIPA
jgi:D-threo-aldose 1-dehydrogenase